MATHGCRLQLGTNVRMRDGDEQFRPPAQWLATQIDRTVLSDDILDMPSGRYHPRSRLNRGNDAGSRATEGRGREREDRLSLRRQIRPQTKSICPPIPL